MPVRRDDGAGGRKNDRRAAQDDDAVVQEVTIPASFCPATMCPLFAAEGSPVSGAYDALCSRDCGWHDGAICRAGRIATGEVIAATATNGVTWPKLAGPIRRRVFACSRASECTWQRQQPGGLCAPRRALAHGLDPRGCA
jgi:hypothetical protein